MKRIDRHCDEIGKLRKELCASIADILDKYGIDKLHVSDIDDCYSPIVMEDYMEANNSYTLDAILRKNGDIVFSASNAWNGYDFYINEIGLDFLADILDWLEDNEDEIKEYDCTNV